MEHEAQDAISPCSGDVSIIGSDDPIIIDQECRAILENYIARDSNDKTSLMLNAFLDYLPNDGAHNLLNNIKECNGNDDLHQLACSLFQCLLLPMQTRPITPAKMTPAPRLGLEDSIENMCSELVQPCTRDDQQWLKGACLERDNKRCVLSGIVDEKNATPNDAAVTDTECAHIIPYSLGTWKSESEQHMKAKIWVTLNRCFPSLRNRIGFTQESINDPRNAMTLASSLHTMFGKFMIALEATDEPDVYAIKNHTPRHAGTWLIRGIDKVSLKNHNTPYNVPDPMLLETHASIARILHATGMAESINALRYRKDKTGTLAADGSTDITALLSVSSLAILSSRPPKQRRPDNRRSADVDGKVTIDSGKNRSVNAKKENVCEQSTTRF